jgi:tRNA threonylcarbamoyl adenosine modification protein (Sua5/YciO/YrdC/YwlC family)
VSDVFEVDPDRPDDRALDTAAAAIERGELVLLPTETVYGLAARPDLPAATERLFEAKRRPSSLNLPVLAPTEAQAWTVAESTPRARVLASAFWPGALTLVLRRRAISAGWWLGDRADTVAMRVPDHPIPLSLLRKTGNLAVTSANISGRAPASDREALVKTFSGQVGAILLLPGAAPPPGGVASTVVDCSGPSLEILRDGAIPRPALEAALGVDLRVHPSE